MTSRRDAIWAALVAIEEWPSWWRLLKRMEVVREATAENGVGAVYRNHVSSQTGYGFAFLGETADVRWVGRPLPTTGASGVRRILESTTPSLGWRGPHPVRPTTAWSGAML
ncbi:MAG: hypothetical protein R6W93_04315 [Candidatus Limnocylindrales bacterium]